MFITSVNLIYRIYSFANKSSSPTLRVVLWVRKLDYFFSNIRSYLLNKTRKYIILIICWTGTSQSYNFTLSLLTCNTRNLKIIQPRIYVIYLFYYASCEHCGLHRYLWWNNQTSVEQQRLCIKDIFFSEMMFINSHSRKYVMFSLSLQ